MTIVENSDGDLMVEIPRENGEYKITEEVVKGMELLYGKAKSD